MKEVPNENPLSSISGFHRPAISDISGESNSSFPSASSMTELEDHPTRPFSKICTRYESHKSAVYAVVFNPYQEPDETPIFATCGSNMVNFYECHISEDGRHDSFTLVQSVRDKASDENFYTCTWCFDSTSPNSPHLLAAGGEYGFIRVIGASNGEDLACLRGHGNYINELRTSPVDSMLLASASKDSTVRLWNVRFDQCLAILGGINGHLDQVLSIDWSSDGSLIASCSMDHTIRVWDLNIDSLTERIINTMRIVATSKPRRKWVFDYDTQLREEMAAYNAKKANEREESRKKSSTDEEMISTDDDATPAPEASRKTEDNESDEFVQKRLKESANKPLVFDEKPAPQTPILITSPVAKTDDLHIDYIDWIRFCGEYMISKGSDGMLKIFRFGNFGEEHFLKNTLKPETSVIRLAELDLPDTNIWFLRTELDPMNKWLPVGNKGGSIYLWRLDKGIPQREADFVLPIGYMTIRHIGWDPLGRVMVAVADGGSITLIRRRYIHEKVDEKGAATKYRHHAKQSKGESAQVKGQGKRRRIVESEEGNEDDRSTTESTRISN